MARESEEQLRLDITALKEREHEIARLSRLYAALSHINQAIICTPNRDALLQKICRAIVEHGGLRMAWVGWRDPTTHELIPVAQYGDESNYLKGLKIFTDDRPEGRGPSGRAFREGRSYISNDLHQDPATTPWRPAYERHRFQASAAFPIRQAGEVCGVLSVYAGEVGFFQDRELNLLEEAAVDTSFALDNLAREDARQRAERTLRQERDFSDAVLNSLPGVLYLYEQGGKFLRWNKNFERVTGYTAAELARLQPLDFFTEAEREEAATQINLVFSQGEATLEASFLMKSGETRPYYFTGTKAQLDGQTCLVGVGLDLSEQKAAEEAQRASEASYRALFEHAPDGILIADAQSRYLDANPSICRMLGYTREALIGLHASDIIAQEELYHIEPALRAINAERAHQREWQLRRRDGSCFAAEVRVTTMPDGKLLAMIRDISERKAAEQTLRELNETLEQKVAARTKELQAALVRAESADQLKSSFLATMSHELRTPLNSILGFTGIILQGMAGPLTAEQEKQLGMVRGSGRHLLELINDVLDLSKIEANQLEVRAEPFDLRASVARVLASMKPLAEKKGLRLHAELDPSLGEMVSDRRRVEQILLNLLNNAIKFTERGGVQLLAARLTAPEPRVCFRVIDSGIGVKPEDLATLFQPFRQLDTGFSRQHEGTGLGLTICQRLAALLGGELSARSAWNQGSEFAVTLPLQKRRGQ